LRQLRVTLLTTSLDLGGAETQVVGLAKGLKCRGLKVNVVSMLPPVAYTKELSAHGIPFATLQMRRGVPAPGAVFRMARLLKFYSTDVLHCHMVGANLLGRITSLITRPPVVISTAHNIHEGPRWRELAYRYTDRLADLTTNVCRAGVKRYLSIGAAPGHKLIYVPNGVELPCRIEDLARKQRVRQSLSLDDKWVWLAVGNLRPQKDYPTLLRAVARMPGRARMQVLVVGSGPEEEQLLRLARDLSVPTTVRFLGKRGDVPDLLSIADGFVMSSAWEGLSLALIEASLARVAIIATDVGGNSEIVGHGASGYLVAARDPAALGSAMTELMGVPAAVRMKMGEAGHRMAAENYSMTAVIDRWIDIYSELYQRRASPRHGAVVPDTTNNDSGAQPDES
jgi:glycosyltransferase involved in cell wall biosynthesis